MQLLRAPWQDNFPDTVIDRPLGDATQHRLYESAKAGDPESALRLAIDLISDTAVNKVRILSKGKSVIFVPVHAVEESGNNAIPVMTAAVLAHKMQATVDTTIVQAIKVSRTGKDGWYRLANPPYFDGEFPQGRYAIMVDDTQTQGGTFAALRGHIEEQGGDVLGAYALTGKQYSVQLKLSNETLSELRHEYDSIELWWESRFGYGFEALTEWEARYIIGSNKSPEEVRNIIAARKQI